jgi:hypothetical protein
LYEVLINQSSNPNPVYKSLKHVTYFSRKQKERGGHFKDFTIKNL